MIFSVYDYATKLYAYYEAEKTLPASGWFRRPGGSSVRGMYAPEAIAAELPSGARYVGSGTTARGVIARQGGLSGVDFSTVKKWAWYAGLGFAAFEIGRRWSRRGGPK